MITTAKYLTVFDAAAHHLSSLMPHEELWWYSKSQILRGAKLCAVIVPPADEEDLRPATDQKYFRN